MYCLQIRAVAMQHVDCNGNTLMLNNNTGLLQDWLQHFGQILEYIILTRPTTTM